MNNDIKDHDLETISALIRQEEEDALTFFRSRNFRDGIERRLKEGTGGKKPTALSQIRSVPVLTGVLVVVIAAILLLILKGPGTAPAPEFKALASALGRLPGFSPHPGREWTVPQGQPGTSRLAESIRQTLITAEQTKREEERAISIPAGTSRVPRLSLDQKMEILFKEKAIEHALLLFKGDSKEV
ncbi:MAG: hypothetical protein OEW18_07590 [Candidatus Aminicenantes bacterium]|nr:hypothetical protein [Candidatus Aminicenantes bacterium]